MKHQRKHQWLVLLPAVLGALIWAVSPLFSLATSEASSYFPPNPVTLNLQANLTGTPINNTQPFGRGDYTVYTSNVRRLKVEVYSVNLPAGTVLQVQVNGASVGNITLSSWRSGALELRTDRNQTVPTVAAGNTLTVKNGDATILNGIFNGAASPSPTGSTSPTGTPRPSVSPTATGTPRPSPVPPLYAQLTGAPINNAAPRGLAQYKGYGTERELEVFVNMVNLPAGTNLTIFVGTANVGQFTLRPDHSGRFETDAANLPMIAVGTVLTVKNGETTILSGTFQNGFPSPSPTASHSPTPRPSVSPTGTPSGSPSPTPTHTPRPARYFRAKLRGSQVVPPVTTMARGEARVLLNEAGTEIQVFAGFFNLSSAQTTASINGPAQPGTNAPAIFNLGTVGGTSGFFPVQTFQVTEAQVAELRAGLWYITIASTNNPAGEIRGQIRSAFHRGDFEGDGLTDISVFRPNGGSWYFLNSSDGAFRAQTLGSVNDRVVSSDYDGDSVGDIAVVRNANGLAYWQIRRSSDEGDSQEQWGLASDAPVVGDFDGDGRSDLAVYRPSSGTWYVKNSMDNSLTATQWGTSEDRPIAADFDGDGVDDIAIFRPSTGMWYVKQSADGTLRAEQWGANSDVPTTGDFDGDGEADIAVFRPESGYWFIKRSLDGDMQAIQFGQNGDFPVAGEFDADGLTDIAVFRPSNGYWYILRSVDDEFAAVQFGQNGDRPSAVTTIP